MTNEELQQLKTILADAPEGAVTVANYDYGDAMELLYINCENEFYEHDEKEWVEMYLVDNYFHTHRRLTDLRTIVSQAEEIEQQAERIAELEKQLNPRLYWDASNTETSYDSIDELMHSKFEDGASVGDEVEIQRATLLPNKTYVFTVIDDEDYSCKYELKDKANEQFNKQAFAE